MKKLSAYTLLVALLVTAGVFILVRTRAIHAQDGSDYPPLVQKLAERFNLNVDEVREVFNEAHKERHQKMQAHLEERLNQVVSKGKITEEQKEAILAKKAEIQDKHKEMRDLSPKERWATMKKHREEMKAWAKENNIGLKRFLKHRPKRHHGGHFGPRFSK